MGLLDARLAFEGRKRASFLRSLPRSSPRSLWSAFGRSKRKSNSLKVASLPSLKNSPSVIVEPSRVRLDSSERKRLRKKAAKAARKKARKQARSLKRRSPPSSNGAVFQLDPIASFRKPEMIPVASKPNDQRNFVHKRLFGAATGFLTGGPTGAIGGFLGSGGGRNRSPQSQAAVLRGRTLPSAPTRGFPVVPSRGLGNFLARTFPGGRTGLEVAAPMSGNGCPSGFHPNKTDYMTQAGFVAAGTKCVKNRRRNLSNGRANTRSLRRLAAWDKQERKLSKTMKAIARGR